MNDITKAAAVLGRKGGSVSSAAKARAVRLNGRKGGRPPMFSLSEIFDMQGGGRAAIFTDPEGRRLRVDFYDRQRLLDHGVHANVEVYGVGKGWEIASGQTFRAKLRQYMVDQILAI